MLSSAMAQLRTTMRHKSAAWETTISRGVFTVPTLVQHLVNLKTAGILSCYTLVYMANLVHIQFTLKTEKNTLVLGHRAFNETVEFTSDDDLLTELYSSNDLVEVVVKTMC